MDHMFNRTCTIYLTELATKSLHPIYKELATKNLHPIYKELATKNLLQRTCYKELATKNLLQRTCYKELATKNLLQRTCYKELATKNLLQRTCYKELANFYLHVLQMRHLHPLSIHGNRGNNLHPVQREDRISGRLQNSVHSRLQE